MVHSHVRGIETARTGMLKRTNYHISAFEFSTFRAGCSLQVSKVETRLLRTVITSGKKARVGSGQRARLDLTDIYQLSPSLRSRVDGGRRFAKRCWAVRDARDSEP